MDRRTFMKLMGGLASMPIIGRIAKPLKSETVQEGIAAVSDKGMELYEMVVAKVIKEGKKIGESGRVDSYKHPDRPDITVDVNQTDGSAEIYFDTDKGSKGYAKIDRDMETGGTDLQEAEEIFTVDGDKDVQEGIMGGIENLDEFTRFKKAMGGQVPAAPSQLVSESDIILGYRGPGGYQGGRGGRSSRSGPSAGPAGGASGGGNYGGNRNPSQTYGGSIFSGGGGPAQTPTTTGPAGGATRKTTPTSSTQRYSNLDMGFQLAKLAALGLDVGPISNTPTTTLYSGTTSTNPFGGKKFFATPDINVAKTYATTGPFRGSPFAGPVTGTVLSAQVPTSEVKGLAKRGLTGTREVVLDPAVAKETFTKGFGSIKGVGNLGSKIAQGAFRAVPGIGTGISIADATSRFGRGDLIGGALSAAGAIPGIGLPALGLQVGYDVLRGMKDGGSVDLTIVRMPDITELGVESLFKTR